MHVDHDAGVPFGFGAHPAEKRFTRTMRPRWRQKNAGIGVVVGLVEFVEESKIFAAERFFIKENEWARYLLQLGRECLDEFLAAHRELALVAHTRRERQSDAGREIGF